MGQFDFTSDITGPIKLHDHSARHEDGGADEIDIGGLNGTYTFTEATAGEQALKLTITDSVTQSNGILQSFLIDHNITGAKSGGATSEGFSADMNIGSNVVYAYPFASYISQSGNPNIGFAAGMSIYLENMGSGTLDSIAGLDIGINSTNVASSRHTGMRIRNHSGTAKSAILIEEAFTDTILRHSPSGVDLNLITLDNSSGAIFYWDDSEQKFRFNKGLYTDGSLALGDDQFITFGGVASLGWETADADVNLLVLALADGGGTDNPTLLIGDQSVLNFDLGDLVDMAAINEPNIVIIDCDADTYFALGYHADDLAHITSNRSIIIEPSGNSNYYIGFATGNDVPSIYGVGSYLRIGNANTTQHSLDFEDDLMVSGELEVGGATFIDGATTFTLPAAEHILIDGRTNQRTETLGAMRWNFTPASGDVGSRAIYLDVNANSVNDTMGMVIDYTATGLAAGFHDMALEINVETSTAQGGTVGAMSVEKSGIGTLAVEAIHASAGVIPLHQESGTFGNLEIAWRYALPTPTWTNVTDACNGEDGDEELFTTYGDILYIGDAATFDELNVTLATVSSKDIKPTFEFSAGSGSWTAFTPNDTTTGFRNTGIITWEVDELVGWATDTVNTTADKYWIRITRTKAGSLTAPIEDRIQIAATTEYGWDENAALTVASIGVGIASDADMGIYISKTFTDTDNSGKAALRAVAQVAKTSAAMTSAGKGVQGQVYLDSTNTQNWTNAVAGLRGVCGFVGTESGSTGTVTNAANFFANAVIEDAATITNLHGVHICTPSVAGSKVTNEYGIYIDDQNTGATLNYAIYTNAGLIRFGGALAGAWDMGSQNLTNVNIDGGTIGGVTLDGAIAGGSQTVNTLGRVGIGTAAVTTASLITDETFTITDDVGRQAIFSSATGAKTSAEFTNSVVGYLGVGYVGAANTQNWTAAVAVQGVRGIAGTLADSTGTITGACGSFFQAYSAGAAVTNAYGVYIGTTEVSGGSIVNGYGLYIDDQDEAGTLNYAIYTNAGNVYFGGEVIIGSSMTLQGPISLGGYDFDAGSGDAQIITTGDRSGLIVKSSHGTHGPRIRLHHEDTTPSPDTVLGDIEWKAYDGAGTPVLQRWLLMRAVYVNVGDGTEAAKLVFYGMNAGGVDNLFMTVTGAGVLTLAAAGSADLGANCEADDYSVGGVAGATGTFATSVTVVNGIVTGGVA